MPVRLVSPQAAVSQIPDGASVMIGGSGYGTIPHRLIEALVRHAQAGRLTIVSNNLAQIAGQGLEPLLRQGRVRRLMGSHFAPGPGLVRSLRAGGIEVDLLSPEAFSEALRAGGARLAAFYTRTGAASARAGGKEWREFDGQPHVLERALRADVALIRAEEADHLGNLGHRPSGWNVNPLMALAADLVMAEVDRLVPVGGLDPERPVTSNFSGLLVVPAQPGRLRQPVG